MKKHSICSRWILFSCFLLLVFISACKTPEEKYAGVYAIEGYTVNGEDSLIQLSQNFMDGNLILMNDHSYQFVKHTIGENILNDSIIGFYGNYSFLNKGKEINFNIGNVIVYVSDGKKYDGIYLANPRNTNFKHQLILDRKWQISKEGSKKLILKSVDNKNAELKLKLIEKIL